jgi:hypothetical protein
MAFFGKIASVMVTGGGFGHSKYSGNHPEIFWFALGMQFLSDDRDLLTKIES